MTASGFTSCPTARERTKCGRCLLKAVEEIQVTRKGGNGAQESPDGRFLYYVKGGDDVASLWRMPLEGGEETQVLDSVWCQDFAVVEQGIYFIPGQPNGEISSVEFLSFATGKVTTIARLGGCAAWGFSVSPDGRYLLYSQYEGGGNDLMLVENFR